MWRRVGLAAAALLLLASPAAAGLFSCAAGCFTPDGLLFDYDYTVQPDGMVYRWDVWSSDPGATVSIQPPNEVETDDMVSNGDGTFYWNYRPALSPRQTIPAFTFDNAPGPDGHTYYTVSAPANFNHCDLILPAGEVCGERYMVWGNGICVVASKVEPMTIFFAQTVIPEPESWALMIVGLGAAGAMLRRARHMAAAVV